MLVEFHVENFKNFNKKLVFRLDQVKNYEFNNEAIREDVVKTALVYGRNGSGKSNLGLAIFDITLNLTDNENNNFVAYRHYLNLENNQNAKFYYKFKFGASYLEYNYVKSSPERMLYEELTIDHHRVLYYDHATGLGDVQLAGTETLNKDLNEKNIAFVNTLEAMPS